MAVMSLIFSDIQKLDTLRVLKMSLIHDLVESITGDLTPNQITKTEKAKLEQTTMEKILQDLPEDLRNPFSEIWQEFVDKRTPESILVHEVDKLEMALQAKIYEKNGDYSIQSFLQSAENEIKDPKLKELFTKIINQ
jgi:putative hydrolase of HD superfamily